MVLNRIAVLFHPVQKAMTQKYKTYTWIAKMQAAIN
jgi:hypothetical protein